MDKRQLRQHIKNQRRNLPADRRLRANEATATTLIQTSVFQKAQHLGLYLAVQGEIDCKAIITAAWSAGKTCYLPKLAPDLTLEFHQYEEQQDLVVNQFGIPEPTNKAPLLTAAKIDLVVLPLVAVDRKGTRLGMGAGYYDRTFAFLQKQQRPSSPILVGLCYDFQLVDAIAAAAHDVPVDMIITENAEISCSNSLINQKVI